VVGDFFQNFNKENNIAFKIFPQAKHDLDFQKKNLKICCIIAFIYLNKIKKKFFFVFFCFCYYFD